MTLRKTPADLDILVITDFTSGQTGQVVRVTRSVGNLGRHLENVTFLNTPSSGQEEKRPPQNQTKEDFSIDDVFQKYISQHPEISPTKKKTDRRKSVAAAFNSIFHSPKAQSPSPKKRGHNHQDRNSGSGEKTPSCLSPSPMAPKKGRRKSVAQTLAKPFVKLKKSGSKLKHRKNTSLSEVSEEMPHAEAGEQTSDLLNNTQTSLPSVDEDEDSAIICLVEEVKESMENVRRIMSTVSFGKCRQSTSSSRMSHAQRLERRDKTYTRAWQIQPYEIARELALIERDLLVRILEAELVDCVWTGHDKEKRAPNITKMVAFFERLVHLVGSEVMHEETPESRANVIAGFITVADHCRVMRNFESLRAVLAGLQVLPVFRMEKTWDVLRTQHMDQYRLFLELCDLMSEESNHRLYQKALKHALKDSACVPLLGIFLQVTAAINTVEHVDPGQVTSKELRSVRREQQARERGVTLTEREPADVLASMTEEEKKLVTRVIRRWKEQRVHRLERDAQRKLNAERNSHEIPTEEPKGWWERRKLNFKRNSKKTVATQPEGKKSWIGWNSDKTSSEEISVIKGVPNGQRTGEGHSFLKKSLWGQLLQDMPTQHSTWSSSFRSWGKGHHEDQSIPPTGVSSHHHILDSDKNLDHELQVAHYDDIHDNDLAVSRYKSVDRKRILAFAFGSADSDEDIPANLAHKPFEMLQQYQMSAVQYRHDSDPEVRDFLLRADYTTETDNYRLSHEKEPSHITS
ncbi:uncharacterized protein LOC144886636 [Branchiostoma floridae x Branchiostoma japonicum]